MGGARDAGGALIHKGLLKNNVSRATSDKEAVG